MDKIIIGILLMISSMVLYGVGNPIIKKAGFNSFTTIIIQIAVLWLSILPFFILTKSYLTIASNKHNLYLLVLAGLTNAAGYYLLVKSFGYLPIWQINMFWVLVPLFGGIAGYFLLHEPLTVKFFIGLFIVFVGLLIALR